MYPAEKILPVAALIRDGSRIGLTDDFPVAFAPYPDGCSYCDASETNLTELFYSWKCESRLSSLRIQTIDLSSNRRQQRFDLHIEWQHHFSALAKVERDRVRRRILDAW